MSEQILKEILKEIKNINESIDSMEGKIDSMEGKIGSMEVKIDSMEGRIGSMEGKIDSMEVKIDSMESTLHEHTGLLNALEHRVEENTAQLTVVAEDVVYIKGDVTWLKEEADRQGTLLEVMAIRSAKQEAEIFKLKKTAVLKRVRTVK